MIMLWINMLSNETASVHQFQAGRTSAPSEDAARQAPSLCSGSDLSKLEDSLFLSGNLNGWHSCSAGVCYLYRESVYKKHMCTTTIKFSSGLSAPTDFRITLDDVSPKSFRGIDVNGSSLVFLILNFHLLFEYPYIIA